MITNFPFSPSKGHNSARGDNSDKKKKRVSYFLMRNLYMKFQNPSFNFFLNGRTNGRTNGQAESNMLPTFCKVGGIIANRHNAKRM